MTGKLLLRISRLRRWYRQRLERRIIAGAVLLTVSMLSIGVLASVAGSIFTIRRLAAQEAHVRSERIAERVGQQMDTVETSVRALAQSALVAAALADSKGREEYLRPLFEEQLIRSAFAAEIALCDDQGRYVLSTEGSSVPGGTPQRAGSTECLKPEVMHAVLQSHTGLRTVRRPLQGTQQLLWVVPVWIPSTGTAEGAIVVSVPGARLLPDSGNTASTWLLLDSTVLARSGNATDMQDRDGQVSPSASFAPVTLQSSFGPLPLTVATVAAVNTLEPVPVGGLVATYVVGLLMLSALTVVGARWLAQRLTQPLHELNRAADSPAALDPATWNEAARIDDEMGELARHLRDMARRLQEQVHKLDAQRQRAEAANAAKTTFLATVSHEMRTPLNAVVGLTELALNESGERQRDMLGLARKSADQLLSLINNVLDITKIEAGVLRVERGVCDLRQIAETVRSLAVPLVSSKPVQFEMTVADDCPPLFEGDELRTSQILINLVSNAIKFTPAGFVRVSVAPVRESGTAMVAFRVSDTGIGVDPASRARIFEPFEQADSSTTRQYGGTGLGLAISKRLADLLGGRIELDSMVGRGSTFTLLLPCVVPAAGATANAPPPAARAARAAADHVALVVDDEPVNRMILMAQLAELGIAAREAGSGEEALALCDADPSITLVFMDLHMPGMTGLQTCRHLVERAGTGRTLTVVACTADVMTADRNSCLDAGMSDYLSKPVTMDSLVQVIERCTVDADRAAEVAGAVAGARLD